MNAIKVKLINLTTDKIENLHSTSASLLSEKKENDPRKQAVLVVFKSESKEKEKVSRVITLTREKLFLLQNGQNIDVLIKINEGKDAERGLLILTSKTPNQIKIKSF